MAAEASTFQCSPALHRRDGETCLPESTIDRLIRIWNRTHPRYKIKMPSGTRRKKRGTTTPAVAGRKSDAWNKLRDAMVRHYDCNTEYCAVKRMSGIPDDEKHSMLRYFRPEKPATWDKKPTQWLDSYNIEDVMTQYEAADPTFEFIGPVPIDFDKKVGTWGKCIVDELCKLDINAMNGKQKIGIIFNLDAHDEPGSHWVCAYFDLVAKAGYYFDSYGIGPPSEILRLFKRCKDQGCTDFYFNDIRHQRKGSECGMYCLFVLICLLRGRPFYSICKRVVDDDTMNAFRDILFAEEKPRHAAIEDALPTLCI